MGYVLKWQVIITLTIDFLSCGRWFLLGRGSRLGCWYWLRDIAR